MPSMRADDGVEIHYDVWGDDGVCDDGGAPPVVLHHGFSADADREWVDSGMVAALVAAGRRVIALDARGHGRSGKPTDSASYGEPRMARDVVALLDELGLTSIDLVGYSMGAIASLFVATCDTRVRRLVVGGVGAGVVELGGIESRVLDPLVLREAILAEDPATITDPGAASFRAWIDVSGADRPALAAVAGAVNRDRIPLERVSAPTLVVAGRDDALAPRPEVLAAAIADADLLLLDGDHGDVVGATAFRDAVLAFVAG